MESVGGKIKLLELLSPIYQRASLYTFVERLQQLIDQQHQVNEQPPLPSLIAEHRRLLQERLITVADYDRAKINLFQGQGASLTSNTSIQYNKNQHVHCET